VFDLTPGERRGAAVLVVILMLGTVYDLWRTSQPAAPQPPVVASAVPAPPAPDSIGGPAAPAPLDLNRATIAQLDALPGIGPVLAARITEQRRLHGSFRATEELLGVPGIGPRLFARLRPLVTTAPRVDTAPDSAFRTRGR